MYDEVYMDEVDMLQLDSSVQSCHTTVEVIVLCMFCLFSRKPIVSKFCEEHDSGTAKFSKWLGYQTLRYVQTRVHEISV